MAVDAGIAMSAVTRWQDFQETIGGIVRDPWAMTESDRSHDKQGSAARALSEQELRELYRKWSAKLSDVHGHERAELEEWLREYTGWNVDAPRLDDTSGFDDKWKLENCYDPLDPVTSGRVARLRRKLGLPS
jgi:hypothetical protein